ncbi:hypothetical protein TNCV_1898621, partial [Trichonephila clavipes]
RRQEEEPMDWDDVPFFPEVSAPFVPSRPPRKMRSLISVQVSEPPSLSANSFPNMRALVPKTRGGVSLHSRGCPEEFLKRAASRDQSSRPPRGVPRATLYIELMTAADGLLNRRQEEEPMDWDDVPFFPEVSAPFVPSRPPRKMRSLISVQVSEPPSLSANSFPNMRALVPKVKTPQAPKVSVMSIVFNVVSPITSYFASFFF